MPELMRCSRRLAGSWLHICMISVEWQDERQRDHAWPLLGAFVTGKCQ